MPVNTIKRWLCWLVAGLALSPLVQAEAPTPGAVKETVKPAPAAPEKKATTPAVEAPAPATAGVPAGGPAVPIKRFEISGNSAIGTDDLRKEIAGFEGKKLTLSEIYAAADRLTSYYHSKGYALASVTVPAQQISSGTVRLEVIEGRLGRVSVTGNKRYSNDFLKRQMLGLTPGAILTIRAVEDQLLKLNRLPGMSARATIQPGETYGTSDVVVKAAERLLSGGVTLDNYGRVAIGEWRLTGRATVYNPLSFGDQLDLDVLHSEAGLLEYGHFNYDLPVGNLGTHAEVYYSRYDYNVNTKELVVPFPGKLSGEGENFGLNFLHPFMRKATDELDAGIGIDTTNTEQRGILGQKRHLTLMRLSGTYSHQYANNALSILSAEYSTNFRGNKVTPTGTLNNRQKGKFRVDATHVHPLPHSWSVLVRGSGVLSFDPLADTERFRIGGPGSIRAFPSSELSGDQGISGTVELRRPLGYIPSLPMQFSAFYDIGLVYQKDPVAGEHRTDSLSGFGFSLSALIARYYTMDFVVAQPTTALKSSDLRDTRLWVAFGAQF